MPGEPGVEAREAVGDGVEPGHDHELADAEQLLLGQGLALDLGVDEVREEVVAGVASPLGDEPAEPLVRPFLGIEQELVADLLAMEEVVLQMQEEVELVGRQAHEVEEHAARQRDRELLGEVALAAFDEPVDQFVGPPGDVGLELLHGLGTE